MEMDRCSPELDMAANGKAAMCEGGSHEKKVNRILNFRKSRKNILMHVMDAVNTGKLVVVVQANRMAKGVICTAKAARQRPHGNVWLGNAIVAVRLAKTSRHRLCRAFLHFSCAHPLCHATSHCRVPTA
jgi:hypothetical protein